MYIDIMEKVSTRWRKAFFKSESWKIIYLKNGKSSEQIYQEILQIEETTPTNLDAIDQAIGGPMWTRYQCSSCNKLLRIPVISFDVNGGEYTYNVCKDCLEEALIKLGKLND